MPGLEVLYVELGITSGNGSALDNSKSSYHKVTDAYAFYLGKINSGPGCRKFADDCFPDYRYDR